MKKYKHIIWDWNGTILDDVNLSLHIINELLISEDLPEITLEKYRDVFTFPVKDYYTALGLGLHKRSFEELGQIWIRIYESRKFDAPLFAPVRNIFNDIAGLNISQSVLSAYMHDPLAEMIEHYSLTKYFTELTGLDNIYASGKLELAVEWKKRNQFAAGEVLFIGDTLHDFEVAKAIDADCVLIANGHQSYERLLSSGASVLHNHTQLAGFLKK